MNISPRTLRDVLLFSVGLFIIVSSVFVTVGPTMIMMGGAMLGLPLFLKGAWVQHRPALRAEQDLRILEHEVLGERYPGGDMGHGGSCRICTPLPTWQSYKRSGHPGMVTPYDTLQVLSASAPKLGRGLTGSTGPR